MADEVAVTAGAGSLRGAVRADAVFAHKWTAEGVAVETQFTGAHLLHLAVAGCVLNDLYREAANLGVQLQGVRVSATGGFDPDNWQSTGVAYQVQLDSPAADDDLARLLRIVDEVAEIPRAFRSGASVTRTS